MRTRRTKLLVLLAGATLSSWVACHGHGTNDPCGEPEYGGRGSDEAWMSMVDGETRVTSSDTKAPSFTTPTEGQTLPSTGAAPLVQWTAGSVGSGATTGLFLFDESCPTRTARRRPLWKRLTDLLVSDAWAHLPPVTGAVYYVRFAITGRACEVRLLTTETSWQATPAAWEAFKASPAGSSIRIKMSAAYLRDNRITEGPFKPSTERTFVIGR